MAIATHDGMLSFWRAKVRDYGYTVDSKWRSEETGQGQIALSHDKYGGTVIPYSLQDEAADLRFWERMAQKILLTGDPASWRRDTYGG